jgi:hypothetical protein
VLWGTIVVLTVIGASGQMWRYIVLDGGYPAWVGAFDLNKERNFPTYYQGVTLLGCAVLLALIAVYKWKQRDRFRVGWAGLVGVFVVLSMDELCELHEQMHVMLDERGVVFSGVLHYSWVVPALIMGMVFGLAYLRFLWHLPVAIRWRFALAGVVYAFGAVGMEMIAADYDQKVGGDNNLIFQLINNLEECLEMSGIALFILALLRYMADTMPPLKISIERGQPEPATEAPPQLVPAASAHGGAAVA